MDTGLTFSTRVTNVVSVAFSHLKNIASIYDHFTHDAAQTIVHSYVTNKLDYCNYKVCQTTVSQSFKIGCQLPHSGHLLMTIYYWWNPKPDLCHTVIEHFAKLPLSSGIDYQGISDTANLILICNSIITHVIYLMCFS